MQTALFSLCNRAAVPVFGILYDTRRVYESTFQGIFRCVKGLTEEWGAMHFDPCTGFLLLHAHPVIDGSECAAVRAGQTGIWQLRSFPETEQPRNCKAIICLVLYSCWTSLKGYDHKKDDYLDLNSGLWRVVETCYDVGCYGVLRPAGTAHERP
jgi:hypothetical protein